MHIYGITVVIILKFCEDMKSETKIVLINYNTHVHTLSKKIFFFWISSFLAKTKGGAGHLVPKKRTFLGRQIFLADYVAGGPKIWPGEKKLLVWPGSSRIFYLNQKQKSYVTLKSVNSKFLKNRVAPPLKRRYRKEHLYLACIHYRVDGSVKKLKFGITPITRWVGRFKTALLLIT